MPRPASAAIRRKGFRLYGFTFTVAAMATTDIEASQRTAARVVGICYLVAMATAVLGFAIRGAMIVPGDGAATAASILASETLFRIGILSDVFTFIVDIVLIAALYVVLQPVNRDFAMLAAFWRLMETALLLVATLNGFAVLRILTGTELDGVVEAEMLHAQARMTLNAYGDGYRVGFAFLGLGSALFSYLWLKSRYVPRSLAWLGVVSSLLLAACNLAAIVWPGVARATGLAYMMPLGVFEIGMGLWLLFRGLKPPVVATP